MSAVAVVAPVKTLAERVPHFQSVLTRSHIVITEYTKNVTADCIQVMVDETGQAYSITIKMPDNSVYTHSVKLFAPVESEFVLNINAYKVEITLKKKKEEDWLSLEEKQVNMVKRDNVIRDDVKAVYPSSSLNKADFNELNKIVQ